MLLLSYTNVKITELVSRWEPCLNNKEREKLVIRSPLLIVRPHCTHIRGLQKPEYLVVYNIITKKNNKKLKIHSQSISVKPGIK